MSDLDNEEIEATKKLQEKSADEMFEALGYEKIYIKDKSIKYEKDGIIIEFNLLFKSIASYEVWEDGYSEQHYLSMQELEAINKKCKELKWI